MSKLLHLKKRTKHFVRGLRGHLVKEKISFPSHTVSEAELLELVGKDDPIILDIGCNDGRHTLAFLRLFKRAKVYCFEPDLRAIKRFKSQVRDSRARLFEMAISDVDGVDEFHVSGGRNPEQKEGKLPEGWDKSGSIRKPNEHLDAFPWCTFDEKIEVKTKKLDTWCQEEGIDTIDFIWADVQGAELNLIRGGSEALGRTRYFFTEYNNRELYEGQISFAKMLELLPQFEIVHQYENDALLRNADLN